jgi:hypothetical protein
MIPWSAVSSVESKEFRDYWNQWSARSAPALRLHDGSIVKIPGVPWLNWRYGMISAIGERRRRTLETFVAFCDQADVPVDEQIRAALNAALNYPFQPAAGWYPDPADPNQQRWWDGLEWTDTTRDTSV